MIEFFLFELIILVVDGGIFRWEGNVILLVVVEDVNDWDLEFESKSYLVIVYFGVLFGIFIVMVFVGDNDIGFNVEFEYIVIGLFLVFKIVLKIGIIIVV